MEIFSDSKPTIEVLGSNGKVSAKGKPYVDNIQELCVGRNVSFSRISREENKAGFKLEGHSCDKEIRDIERKILNNVKAKDYQRNKR